LYLVSDRALDPEARQNRYGGVYKTLDNSPGPAALVCLEGAGPLSSTDHPAVNPIYQALFPGQGKTGWRGRDFIDAAAAVIGNFAALAAEAPGSGGKPIPGLHIETRSWNLPELRYILKW
jgi:hypothetical protein